jgi:CubicO group peptidase (beta-lactamase class C family)
MKLDAIFDLASLTKPLATTLALMKLVDGGRVGLDQPLSELLPLPLENKADLTPRLILSHSAGFTAWRPFYLDLEKYPQQERKERLRRMVMDEPLACEPGQGTIYSDLGFMVLEWVIEKAAERDMAAYLDEEFYRRLDLERTFFVRFRRNTSRFAATEACPWRKRIIRGEVHDENAFALGGYSGHAGLFGTAEEVYGIANCLREHYRGERDDFLKVETVREFFRRQEQCERCTWALGWDTPSPEKSSAGRHFSRNSVGHLGFTGASVWMDLDKDVVIVLLTNRIHPTRKNEKIKRFRPELHDAVMEEMGMGMS